MVKPCEHCGCNCITCDQLRVENLELKDNVQKLQDQLLVCGKQETSLQLHKEQNNCEGNKQPTNSELKSSQEQVKRLQDIYDETVKKNQELESRILQMGGELQKEKASFEETVAAMTVQLMDSMEKMNKLEKESIKNKKDCSLVVQLLKCNQSLDKKFVSQKVDTLPSELKDKVKGELDLDSVPEEVLNHPPWSKKMWRSKSTSGLDGNANTDSPAKSRRHAFMNRRTKSTIYGPPQD